MKKNWLLVLSQLSLALLLAFSARIALGASAVKEVSYQTVQKAIHTSEHTGKAESKSITVTFHGQHIHIVVIAVQPGMPDTTYDVHGLADPTLVVPAGSHIRLTVINMDFGANMPHELVIGKQAPAYPKVVSVGKNKDKLITPALPPRTAKSVGQSQYFSTTTQFQVPKNSQKLYYFCVIPGHASKGMYGRLKISRAKSGGTTSSS